MPSPIDDEILQRFYDGDLSPAEARGLSARIAGDPAAQRRLRELETLTELVREVASQTGDALDSDALFRAIEAGLPQRAAPSIAPPAPSNVRTLGRRRGGWFPALAATAVAAATLLVVLRSGEPDAGGGEAMPAQIGVKMEALNERNDDEASGLGAETYGEREPGADAALVSTARGSRLEHVDFGHNTGTAFLLEGDGDGVGVTVVWLNEPGEQDDGDAR